MSIECGQQGTVNSGREVCSESEGEEEEITLPRKIIVGDEGDNA